MTIEFYGEPDFVDEFAAIFALFKRVPEHEQTNWATHIFMLGDVIENFKPNCLERHCADCDAWYEGEWFDGGQCTLTLSVSTIRPCGASLKIEDNVVRSYSLEWP